MKIFSSEQIYKADKITVERQGITSEALMERAASQIFKWMDSRLQGAPVKIHLFCGIGNNGGDGIALARMLKDHGYHIEVYVVNYSKTRSADFLVNLERLKERKIWPIYLDTVFENPAIHRDDIIVDAVFGIGLNRPPATWVAKLLQHLNASGAYVLSVDVPSGLYMDRGLDSSDAVIRANHVLSFQAPKLVFFLPDTGRYAEQWEILDIGLDAEYLKTTETDFTLVGKNEVLDFYKPREKFSHKGTYGHSLIIGGSNGKMGAVHLAGKASLRVGSGLVSLFVPSCGLLPLQTNLPEAMVHTDVNEHHISDIKTDLEKMTLAVGIGMGTEKESVLALSALLDVAKAPMVIDADGLNIIAANKELLKKLPEATILTPHPKELERLLGKWGDDFDKLKKAKAFSKRYGCVLVIKGAYTLTVFEGKGYFNSTGNPGMATGGSGDVLTGMVVGLLAQGYSPLQAAIFAVYLHGRAGDIAVSERGYQGLIASDIIEAIGKAFIDLFQMPEVQESNEEPQS
ncbi:MAG: NAD(P)H-hydrate dehydratase [Flavobacteriaceae bacterium]